MQLDKAIQEVIKNLSRSWTALKIKPQQPARLNPKWIVDPIDGTVNFANGISNLRVSIDWSKWQNADGDRL